jgi:hypothetical protein
MAVALDSGRTPAQSKTAARVWSQAAISCHWPTTTGRPASDGLRSFRSAPWVAQTGHQSTLADADWASASDGKEPSPAADRTGAFDPEPTFLLAETGRSERRFKPTFRRGIERRGMERRTMNPLAAGSGSRGGGDAVGPERPRLITRVDPHSDQQHPDCRISFQLPGHRREMNAQPIDVYRLMRFGPLLARGQNWTVQEVPKLRTKGRVWQ